jgi:hypothetical protein
VNFNSTTKADGSLYTYWFNLFIFINIAQKPRWNRIHYCATNSVYWKWLILIKEWKM